MKKQDNVIIGIYKIINPKGKIYIGQSINIKQRFDRYKNITKKDKQHKLYNSFLKYGVINHKFEIIEECKFEDLNIRERYWQDYYNVLEEGLNCVLTNANELPKKMSEETKRRISEATKGLKDSEETRLKKSTSKKGKPNLKLRKPRKEGSGENISNGRKGKKANKIYSNKNKPNHLLRKPILQYDLEGNFIQEWSSQVEARKLTNSPSIQQVLKGKTQTSGGYVWRYK